MEELREKSSREREQHMWSLWGGHECDMFAVKEGTAVWCETGVEREFSLRTLQVSGWVSWEVLKVFAGKYYHDVIGFLKYPFLFYFLKIFSDLQESPQDSPVNICFISLCAYHYFPDCLRVNYRYYCLLPPEYIRGYSPGNHRPTIKVRKLILVRYFHVIYKPYPYFSKYLSHVFGRKKKSDRSMLCPINSCGIQLSSLFSLHWSTKMVL